MELLFSHYSEILPLAIKQLRHFLWKYRYILYCFSLKMQYVQLFQCNKYLISTVDTDGLML